MDPEAQMDLKTETPVIRGNDDLSVYLQTIYHLNLNDFKESLYQMKLLLINQRQAQFDLKYSQILGPIMELWQYVIIHTLEIQLKQPNNISFLLLIVILQLLVVFIYSILYLKHAFIIAILKHLIINSFYGYSIVILLKRFIPDQHFHLIFVVEAFLYSLFLFTIYNYLCLVTTLINQQFIVNLLIVSPLEVNNMLNLFANYQFYYTIFKQISSKNY
ncbi:unnamed protein product (macronuclear) [Paramecium tetraurelia]|uniref:Transmembrane protein n=1 Tax=Paramecium tetraurelia TaxID=5888 RepID=A0BEB6_PARTE|nr:uncharacterized protein GSPATT00027916001 [Paramecium tetraurelia]CAK56883.1 unnamed protein product [Paramecium tetraurelia]|eukprot:XP_001424281.1 hypothetical protein (macronuclear) [Paramecium tetraurelia strain d4-2]